MNNEFSREEEEILNAYEKNEFKEIPNMEEEIKKHVEYARATYLKKQNLDLERKQNISEAIKIQNDLKKYSKGWDGVSEIRKWREPR